MSLALVSTSGTFTTQIVEGDKAETIAPIVSGTAVTATGTSVDFTGIPNWVKRITVMFVGVSTTGTSPVQIQIGSGALVTTGYLGAAMLNQTAASVTNHTTGFRVEGNDALVSAASTRHGSITLNRVQNGSWVINGGISYSNTNVICSCCGSVPIAGILDRIRVTTVVGTETFDAGTINIMWE